MVVGKETVIADCGKAMGDIESIIQKKSVTKLTEWPFKG